MSLASAQRALATKNRELLQESSQIKLTQSMTESIGKGLGRLAGFVGEHMNVEDNVQAWESVEAGRDYLGMDKDAIAKPSLRQKWFKKPSDMIGENIKIDDKSQISLGNLQSLGTLAKSENRSLYESIAGDKGLRGAYVKDIESTKSPSSPSMPLPEHQNPTKLKDGTVQEGKAPLHSDLNQIQKVVQKGMLANKVDGKYNFDAARSNYYKQMNEKNKDVKNAETISPEAI